MYKQSADSQGFTLIELTVVILTIAILMGFVFTASQGALDRARKTQAKNDLSESWQRTHGKLPSGGTASTGDYKYKGSDDVLSWQ